VSKIDLARTVSERFGIIRSMPAVLTEIGFEPVALEQVRSLFQQIAAELENLVAAEVALFDKRSQSESFDRYWKQCRQASRTNPAVFLDLPGAEQFDGLKLFPTWNCDFILSRIQLIRKIVVDTNSEQASNANANLDRFVRRIRTEWLHQSRRLNGE
jgi:hypothetical protein